MRILIANRGEIAVRILRTAHRLGHETVAVYADPDRDAPHVRLATFATRLGPAELAESYLSVDAVLAAADRTTATAVHPGYGFLAERAAAARAFIAAGLTWIGPRPEAIEMMGSKIEARRLADQAGVPIIPGFDASQDDESLAAAAASIGYPVLIKASAGGGGKGIRIALTPADFSSALAEARLESARAFGDDAVIVERYILRPRHIEVQVVGDQYGNVADLGTRECSVQRRYQKVLEEAPAPNLDPATEAGLRSAATALAKLIDYDSLGTVEFVLDDESGEAFFLEMNTRIQVEHPVTEAVTGLDLVEIQLRVATGERTPFPASGAAISGHAFEARINAEDPYRDYRPATGAVSHLQLPGGVRWDSGIETGSVISPRYDSLLGKLVAHGPDRDTARRHLLGALERTLIGGVRTNTGLQRWLLLQAPVRTGHVTTRFLDETEPPVAPDIAQARFRCAILWLLASDLEAATADVWHRLGRKRLTPHHSSRRVFLEDLDGEVEEVLIDDGVLADARYLEGQLSWTEHAVVHRCPAWVDLQRRRVCVAASGVTHSFVVRSRIEQWGHGQDASTDSARTVTSPFPAVVAEVHVAPGDLVSEGQVLMVIEAMKMLHPLVATGVGVVAEVRVGQSAQVGSGEVLIAFEEQT
jgi:acetyl/propionyl-CoA carboxylase alpha subunit